MKRIFKKVIVLLILGAFFVALPLEITGLMRNEKAFKSEAEEKIEQLGGKASSSVSKKTSAVIVGANPGSKYEKAKELLTTHRAELDKIAKYLYNKETITGEEFMQILSEDHVFDEEKTAQA